MKNILILLISLLPVMVVGQTLKGKIIDKTTKEPMPFATVNWLGTNSGSISDEKGYFEIPRKSGEDNLLLTSFTGYQTDTLTVSSKMQNITIALAPSLELNGVEIKARVGGSYVSNAASMKTEVITSVGLCQLACCSLAESFENSATVDVGFSDAVSGARQIQMLGLAGVYSQLLYENMPFLRGLSSPFGLSYIPGSYMESIQVSKGAASVVNGFESMTGQINVEYKKPQTSDPFFLNLFGSSDLKGEMNAIGTIHLNDKLATSLFGHVSYFNREFDHVGHDGFMDQPKSRQFNIVNRWSYDNKNYRNVTSLLFVDDHRVGGQMGFDPDKDVDTTGKYGFENRTQRAQVFTKNGFVLNDHASIGTQLSATYMDLNATYGIHPYHGIEKNLYANVIGQYRFNKEHQLESGVSYQLNDVDETYQSTIDRRTEHIPGVFAQYTYTPTDDITVIGGLRYDYQSFYDQNMITPRLHLRWQPFKMLTLRGSVGKGYRSANILVENMGLMASSRQFAADDNLSLEESWNYGVNAMLRLPAPWKREMTLSLDAYRTDFLNQVMVDMDRDAHAVYFYNLNGQSYSNSFQAEWFWDVAEFYNLTVSGRYNDVKATYDDKLLEKPYVNKWKVLFVNSLMTKFDKWRLDWTVQLNGKSRLPNTNGLAADYSDPYAMMYVQLTRKFKHIDVYAGVENITNYTQPHPILDYEHPFGENFDASVTWGPLMGRMFYAGLRWTIK